MHQAGRVGDMVDNAANPTASSGEFICKGLLGRELCRNKSLDKGASYTWSIAAPADTATTSCRFENLNL